MQVSMPCFSISWVGLILLIYFLGNLQSSPPSHSLMKDFLRILVNVYMYCGHGIGSILIRATLNNSLELMKYRVTMQFILRTPYSTNNHQILVVTHCRVYSHGCQIKEYSSDQYKYRSILSDDNIFE